MTPFHLRDRLKGLVFGKRNGPDDRLLVGTVIDRYVNEDPRSRLAVLQWAFTRQESPYVQAFQRLGGIEKAVQLHYFAGVPPDVLEKFRVPERAVISAEEIAANMVIGLGICGINHPGLDKVYISVPPPI